MAKMVFKPKISPWIKALYIVTLLFVISMTLVTIMEGFVWFYPIIGFVAVLFSWIFSRANNMEYTIAKDFLLLRGPFNTEKVFFKDISKIEKTPIPFGIRLAGASFVGGWYYFPGIGRAWVSMGNFSDGVMVHGKKKYLVTPDTPEKFIKELQKKITRGG